LHKGNVPIKELKERTRGLVQRDPSQQKLRNAREKNFRRMDLRETKRRLKGKKRGLKKKERGCTCYQKGGETSTRVVSSKGGTAGRKKKKRVLTRKGFRG